MSNRTVSYISPGHVEVVDTPYPEFELKDGPGVNPANVGRKVHHGVVLRTVATNICGSDQHMVRGRTTAPARLIPSVIHRGVDSLKPGAMRSAPWERASNPLWFKHRPRYIHCQYGRTRAPIRQPTILGRGGPNCRPFTKSKGPLHDAEALYSTCCNIACGLPLRKPPLCRP